MPLEQRLSGDGDGGGWDNQYFFVDGKLNVKKLKIERIKRFIWVNGPNWIFLQKGARNKRVDVLSLDRS